MRSKRRKLGLDGLDMHVVQDLEFDLIKVLLEAHCHNPTAVEKARELEPMRRRRDFEPRLQEVAEMLRIQTEDRSFPAIRFEELDREIDLLNVEESILSEDGFHRILEASRLVNDLISAMKGGEEELPRLAEVLSGIPKTLDLIRPIEAVFDAKGQVKADASTLLVKIRQDMQRVRRTLNRNFLRAAKLAEERHFLADTREGFVMNRRVLAVVSTHKRKVSGQVVGQTKTGNITFIEPAINVPLNFEMEMLRDDEQKEILRILRDLTRGIRKHRPLVLNYQRALTELEWIHARTKLAKEFGGTLPALQDGPGFHLIDAYHPLLHLTNQSKNIPTVPQTLRLNHKGRMLVISGPNAGGKSITLKTVGLLQLMLQSGLLIPVSANSVMGCFNSILTDIGDNQSIENQLSTYSYRLNRMRGFLQDANQRSLLLLDEFGTGSDPELGGALAEVFFEELYNRQSFGVITTHYANIKTRAARLKNALNGSMQFDRESLEPLFQLDIGTPGSSFTFEVAEINGIAPDLIERAKGKLDRKKVELDGLIGSLQKEKAQVGRLTDEQLKLRLQLDTLQRDLALEREHLDGQRLTQHEVAESQNHNLQRGRRLQQYIDRFRSGTKNAELIADIVKFLAVEKTKLESAVLKAKTKSRTAAKFKAPNPKRRPKHFTDRIRAGSKVRLRSGNERGEVIAIDGKHLTVLFGSFKTRVTLEKLTWVSD